MAESDARAVHELIKGQRICMLTTVEHSGGGLVARPMTVKDKEFTGDLAFLALADSGPAQDVEADPRSNVTFTGGESFVSLRGHTRLTRDQAVIDELWDDISQAWLQCERDDPRVGVLQFTAQGAEYWSSPGKASTLVDLAKAKVSGERPSGGDSGTVDL